VGRLRPVVEWWDALDPPHPTGALATLVLRRQFEIACLCVLFANVVFTWYATNYEIRHIETGPSFLIHHVDHGFMCYYALELLSKLAVHRQFFFCNGDMWWNLFDTLLVILSLSDLLLSCGRLVDPNGTDTDVTFMLVLRILKMAKLTRGLTFVKYFPELRLIVNSLVGSLAGLMWSIIMMLLIFFVFALFFVQGAAMHLYLHRGETTPGDIGRVMSEFGSVEKALLALYRAVTGGEDWSVFYRVVEVTGPLYTWLFIFFIAFSHIAFLNILTATFVNKAMQLAKPDADTLANDQRKRELEAYEELHAVCRSLGSCDSGCITVQQLERHLGEGLLGARLAILGLHVTDAQRFFDALSAGGKAKDMTSADFVEGCMRMRGAASGVDLHRVDMQVQVVFRCLQRLQEDVGQRLVGLADAITGLRDGSSRVSPSAAPPTSGVRVNV